MMFLISKDVWVEANEVAMVYPLNGLVCLLLKSGVERQLIHTPKTQLNEVVTNLIARKTQPR